MVKRTVTLALLALVAVATADVNPARLSWSSTFFSDSGAIKATKLMPKILKGTQACTTETKTWYNSPYFALSWNVYVQGKHDSAKYDVLFKWGTPYNYDDRIDTVLSGCVAHGDDDTGRQFAAHWTEPFYPRQSYRGYLIFQGTTGNSDSTRIDSVFFLPDVETP